MKVILEITSDDNLVLNSIVANILIAIGEGSKESDKLINIQMSVAGDL